MYNGPPMLRAQWRQGTQGPCAVLLVLAAVLGAGLIMHTRRRVLINLSAPVSDWS